MVVNGIDLGLAHTPGLISKKPGSYTAFFVRGSRVVGWNYCCDQDDDGHIVTWDISSGSGVLGEPGTPGVFPTQTFIDVNKMGRVISRTDLGRPQYEGNTLGLEGWVTNANIWLPKLPGFGFAETELRRINDSGQVLGVTAFLLNNQFEIRLFLLSPVGVPFNPVPEPTKLGFLLVPLAAIAFARSRWRSVSRR